MAEYVGEGATKGVDNVASLSWGGAPRSEPRADPSLPADALLLLPWVDDVSLEGRDAILRRPLRFAPPELVLPPPALASWIHYPGVSRTISRGDLSSAA